MTPKPPVAALIAVLLLIGLAVAVAASDPAPGQGAPADANETAPATPATHASGAHAWGPATGAVPTQADALLSLERRAQIVIDGDAAFNPANGVRSGSGTFADPYIISGWHVTSIHIRDTNAAFVVKENYVSNILVLDWTGQGGHVHHNHIENLRTNRNVERTGDPTAAVIEKNVILRVEELRHFDGEVRNNTIGQSDLVGSLLAEDVVLNIAGLNGAGIHDNVIYGGVDMKIHGHHHSDATGAHSHNHGAPDNAQADNRTEDHQTRYVDFRFYRNRIVDEGFGMRYNDLNHAGDDRTATSEQEPMLEQPHVHHTSVTIEDNVIEGATLRVAVLNSADERHLPGQSATLIVRNNRIVQPVAGDGIVIQDVRDAHVEITGNLVEKGERQLTGQSAILLHRFTNSSIHVDDNTFGPYRIGVRAQDFDANTTWTVGKNRGPVNQAIYWDNSVPNAPGQQPAEHEEGAHAHSHAEPAGEEGGEGGQSGHEGHGHGEGRAPAPAVVTLVGATRL